LASILIGDVAGIESRGELATVGNAADEGAEVLLEAFPQAITTIAASRQAVRAI